VNLFSRESLIPTAAISLAVQPGRFPLGKKHSGVETRYLHETWSRKHVICMKHGVGDTTNNVRACKKQISRLGESKNKI